MNDLELAQVDKLILGRAQQLADSVHANAIAVAGVVASQRYLLEFLFATAFRDNASGFDHTMAELQRMHRENLQRVEPGHEEDAREIDVHVAVHLERFAASTRARITANPTTSAA